MQKDTRVKTVGTVQKDTGMDTVGTVQKDTGLDTVGTVQKDTGLDTTQYSTRKGTTTYFLRKSISDDRSLVDFAEIKESHMYSQRETSGGEWFVLMR